MSHHPHLVLASTSPRRRDLLAGLGLRLRLEAPDVAEIPMAGEGPAGFADRMASEKARRVAERLVEEDPPPILAADTVVARDGALLGKPESEAEAREMLARLAGRPHAVVTGVAVLDGAGALHRKTVTTEVRFRPLTEAEIAWYVATGEPMDKAGAYGMQGIGMSLVAAIHGSPSNVIGLPLPESLRLLADAGVAAPWAGEKGDPE